MMNRMTNKTTSYILWALWLALGLAGLHRIYNKKYISGFLWLFTFGLFGIGQIIDLFLISDIVDEHNMKQRYRLSMSPYGVPLDYAPVPEQVVIPVTQARPVPEAAKTPEQLMIDLTRAAAQRQGRLSVTQAVIDVGCTFEEAEKTLKQMLKAGYVGLSNDPNTGAVVYEFTEL